MVYEKLFKMEDESRLKVRVKLLVGSGFHSDHCKYFINVFTCPKGSRKWVNVLEKYRRGCEWQDWRKLSIADREEFFMQKNFEVAGEERILETAQECWELAKPNMKTNIGV